MLFYRQNATAVRPFFKNVETVFVFVAFWGAPQIVQNKKQRSYDQRKQSTEQCHACKLSIAYASGQIRTSRQEKTWESPQKFSRTVTFLNRSVSQTESRVNVSVLRFLNRATSKPPLPYGQDIWTANFCFDSSAKKFQEHSHALLGRHDARHDRLEALKWTGSNTD
jgi:hypothetical protein